MLDDFKQEEQNADDKIEGEDAYIEGTVDSPEFVNPNAGDEDIEKAASVMPEEVSLEELAEKEAEEEEE